MKKFLTVYLGAARTVTFDERDDEWRQVFVENGALIVTRPDGTKRVFAPGAWVGYDTEIVEGFRG